MNQHNPPPRSPAETALDRLTRAQALGARVIRDLMTAAPEETDAAVQRALGRLGGFLGADLGYVLGEPAEGTRCTAHLWRARDTAPRLPGWTCATARPLWAPLDATGSLHVPDAQAASGHGPVRALLEARGARALLAVPLTCHDQVSGLLGFETIDHPLEMLEGEISVVASVAGVIAAMLGRRRIEAEVALSRAAQDIERRRLRATLSVLPDILLELDHRLRVTGVHANSGVALPVPPAALLGRSMLSLLPRRGRAVLSALLADLERGEIAKGHRLELALNGTRRWFALSAARRPSDLDSDPPGLVIIARDITEAHLHRLELDRLGQIARNTTNLIVITNLDGRIDWVNPAFETRTGYRLQDIRGQSPGTLLQCPQTDPDTVARIARALRDRQPITCEILNRTRAGAHYWVELSIQPLRDPSGAVIGFMSVQTDMTQHHLTAQSLERALAAEKSAREQLRSAVGIMNEAFIQFDSAQRLVLCNRRYHDLYPELGPLLVPGTALADLLKAGVAKGCYDLDTLSPDAWIEAELRGFPLRFTQSSVVQRHGEWYRMTSQPTPDGGRMILLADVTDLKHAEERALAERARAMDASRDGIALLSADGAVLYANAAAVQIFGRADAASVLGSHWRDLFAAPDSDALERTAHAALQTQGFWQGHLQARRASGDPLEIEVSATRPDEGGTLLILRDISERLRIQAEQDRLRDQLDLAQRREEVGQIAAGLTHDFNNLLAAIAGAASLIEETAGDDGKVLAESIGGAVEQASRLLRRLMSLGKESGPKRRLDLRAPLRDAAELVQASLRAPVTLDLTLPDHPIEAMADHTAVLQMVLNLVINARDALTGAPPGNPTRITVALSLADEADLQARFDLGEVVPGRRHARILVSDTGPGMEPEVRARVFSAYFSTKGDRGTGLGLPIVASAVRDHRGALALDTAPGAGARFCILLPLDPAPSDGERRPPLCALTLGADAATLATLRAAGLDTETCAALADLHPRLSGRAPWALALIHADLPPDQQRGALRALRATAPQLAVWGLGPVEAREGWDRILPAPLDPDSLLAALSGLSQDPWNEGPHAHPDRR